MSVIVDKADAARRRRFLKDAAAPAGGASLPAALLVLDAGAAILFAAGLAWAVAAILAHSGTVLPWAALALVGAALRGAAATLAGRSGAARARQAKLALRQRIARAALRQPPGGAPITGTLINTVVDEVEALDGYIGRFLPARHAAALAPLLVLAAAAWASPVSAAILTLTLIPFIVAMALAGGAAADESRRQFEALSRLSGLFADRVRALPIILAFRAQDREAAHIGDAADEVARRTLKVLGIAFLSSGALEFFAALSVALVAVYAGFNLLGMLPFHVPEKLDLARAFFVLALAPEFYAPMRRLAAAYHDRQAAETAANRLRAIEETGDQPAAEAPLPAPGEPAPEIRFRDVEIRYPGAPRPAITGFSLDVAAGETVALLGPSGSGKSSLLHLLLGLAPLTQGSVDIGGDDRPIAGLAAWAGQSPLIVPGSIRDNIALARPDATADEIAAAARAAGLAPLLERRDGGLDAPLDDRGGGLSGGERRRIALARALVKQAPLLLLDEPTAHLDPRSEQAMIATIREAVRGRTALIATHSEALAHIADRVVRLEPIA
ncbi:MAG TPA: thiol reductant ABC exporter subunit CydD [Sphingomonas sp.]